MNMHYCLMRAARPALSFGFALLLGAGGIALAAVVPDVRNTNHNLSTTGPGTVKATSETQVCVFCHTPHAANISMAAPLWNRELSGATYTTYTSSSIEANEAELAAGPGGSSKLCLSCHDGTLAIGNVNVLNGQSPAAIAMAGTDVGAMPAGSGASTGFTRKLGVDLSNDHPISFTYDDTLATADGELRPITGNPAVATRVAGVNPKPQFPLESDQMQCPTCHDPHLRETDPAKGNLKFLRGNRLQQATPIGGNFDATNDIICLSCHDKAGQAWAYSAHANPLTADEVYTDAAATQREFPLGTPVWKAACLNCHDTHTVQGSRRLLREGTDSVASPKSGGNPAIEETCYQCHSNSATRALTAQVPDNVPNIKDDFALAIHMPITNADQGVATEAHDIGTGIGIGSQRGKDFVESRTALGVGNLNNRHVECTDCHNPHRVIKNKLFNANAATPDASGTHQHTDDAGTQHTNIASGVLRGSFGVEPTYASNSFYDMPSGYTVKRGDPGTNMSTLVSENHVTREYQICLKCHSDYGYDDNNSTDAAATRPPLGGPGLTPSGTNGLTHYTNQAREFQAPLSHKGELTNPYDSGAFFGTVPGQTYAADYALNNHRSWHPVMDNTGRSGILRGNYLQDISNNWRPPWNNAVGTQTMYCTDCHGSNVTSDTSVIPDAGKPWGPHGSGNNFILKGAWDSFTGITFTPPSTFTATGICFKCHDPARYGGSGAYGLYTGFMTTYSTTGFEEGHGLHRGRIGRLRCSWCHVAVPHGWKNKALLVNLNDVGPEAGLPSGTQVKTNTTVPYTAPPYYNNAVLKVKTFAASGQWSVNDCGSRGAPGNGDAGKQWMLNSSENCANPP